MRFARRGLDQWLVCSTSRGNRCCLHCLQTRPILPTDNGLLFGLQSLQTIGGFARLAAPDVSGNGKTFVSPVVARIAAEHGVDVDAVPGTGQGGRVTKKDILAFIEQGTPAAPPQPAEQPAQGVRAKSGIPATTWSTNDDWVARGQRRIGSDSRSRSCCFWSLPAL